MKFFHVSIGAMEIAGGLILLKFAVSLVLGEDHGNDEKPIGDVAIYPLAVPLLATPQAIVAVTILFTKAPDMAAKINGYIALVLVLLINVAILVAVGKAMRENQAGAAAKSGAIAGVLLRVVAIMLSALAIELIALGLREYGVLGPAAAIAAH